MKTARKLWQESRNRSGAMPYRVPPISFADLSAAGLRLRPAQAVTVVRELTLRASRGDLPGLPSAHVIRFSCDGEILIEGPVAAGRSVKRAARLLETMLPGFDAPPELRVPGALRLVLARALGTLDLPPYRTLDEFAKALERFAAPDAVKAVSGLVSAWSAAVTEERDLDGALPSADPDDLTISDVRRARRATRLTLSEIAERSRIPVSLLREFEWGYYVNWPAGQYGRTQLVRYARAAGLDEQVIVGAILPEIEASWRVRGAAAAPVPIVEAAIVDEESPARDDEPAALIRIAPSAVPAGRPARNRRWAALLAIPALLAIGLTPALWDAAVDEEAPAVLTKGGDGARDVRREQQQSTASALPSSKTEGADRANENGTNENQTDEEPPASASAPVASRRIIEERSPDPGPLVRPAALGPDNAFSPAFASVGSAMFYHADDDGPSAIMRADTDSSGAVLRVTSIVDDNSRNFHARPSPDGRYVAFDSDRDGERAVYVAEASGRNVRRVTGEGFAAVPSWSPDGRTLAFVRAEPRNPRVWNLWTVDLESGETRRLTSHRIGQPWGGAWFPDGRRIAYSHESRLIVKSLDGGPDRVYPAPKKNGWMRTPAVSPDGRRIVFQLHGDGAWLLDVPDGSMRKILSDRTAEEFTWSPDGRRIAYHSRKSGKWGVWIMAPR